MELDATKQDKDKKGKKCFNCGKFGHFAKECKKPKKEWKPVPEGGKKQLNATNQQKIETSEPEVEHKNLNWTFCYDDNCYIHLSSKQDRGWFPKKPRGEKKTFAVTEKRPIKATHNTQPLRIMQEKQTPEAEKTEQPDHSKMPMCEKLARLRQYEAEQQQVETTKIHTKDKNSQTTQEELEERRFQEASEWVQSQLSTIRTLAMMGRRAHNYGLPDPEDTEQEEEQQDFLNWIEQQSRREALQLEEEREIPDRQPEEIPDDNFEIKCKDDEYSSDAAESTSEDENIQDATTTLTDAQGRARKDSKQL
ncbi:hypothetical protein E5D57_002772 [Metarhizium anisopliae]|nr:hypothetical protein E5D57_013069 [Metarhizium anisopliae]KAF5125716.1 hypothetical protein E5D57_010406 [Metarhizium anisopliae]KAF5125717.1 hypothetical protein E5D57_010407 [Metarhizium anisopliae]KAF5137158.1 hypothetical protein E5D57_000934 [Metarhizium anisopliae]KAF5138983.1 hypothetical protein E5D57_002772 [Metarhizium anisopliae]